MHHPCRACVSVSVGCNLTAKSRFCRLGAVQDSERTRYVHVCAIERAAHDMPGGGAPPARGAGAHTPRSRGGQGSYAHLAAPRRRFSALNLTVPSHQPACLRPVVREDPVAPEAFAEGWSKLHAWRATTGGGDAPALPETPFADPAWRNHVMPVCVHSAAMHLAWAVVPQG